MPGADDGAMEGRKAVETELQEARGLHDAAEVRRLAAKQALMELSGKRGGPEVKTWHRRNLVRRLLTVKKGAYRAPGGRLPWKEADDVKAMGLPVFKRFCENEQSEEETIAAVVRHREDGEFVQGSFLEEQEIGLLLMAMGEEEPPEDVHESRGETPQDYLDRLVGSVRYDRAQIRKEPG